MQTKVKATYESPALTVLEIRHEGVLCGSGDAKMDAIMDVLFEEENWNE